MSFWDVPGVKAGAITGDAAMGLLKHAKTNGYAIPAVNCASATTVNAVLEAGHKLNRPVMVQFSEGSSAMFTGKSLPNDAGVLQGSTLGAVVGAHYVRMVAPAYGIPVLVTTDACVQKSLPWLDAILEADDAFFKAHGEPLFSSHAIGEGVAAAKYMQQMAPMKIILEIAAMGDVSSVYQQMSQISNMFTISTSPEYMKVPDACFVFSGGFTPKKQDIAAALSSGMVKLTLDTHLVDSEAYMAKRVMEICADTKNKNTNGGVIELGVDDSWLTAEAKAALKATADFMSTPGKGFLAADESAGPWLRAGHSEAAKIPDTIENRAAYRSTCFKTPGLSQYISGVILHWETLFQSDSDGNKMVDLITSNGMIPGIKLDLGYGKEGLSSTANGPLGHPETWDKGIDDLEKRCAQAYAQGARFAKWRNVLQIDPAKRLPSELSIDVAVKNLAHYAIICQRNGLVPIVEPEIVPNGSHPIEVCADVTERVLAAQFAALKLYGCYLGGAVLKPNMVKNGLTGPKAPPEVVAEKTITALLKTVPTEMPGIFFLSGETALDEDNEETATNNLNAMNKMYPKLPWSVSFSYGKALQKTAIVCWMGKNTGPAQNALLNRSKANSDACRGTYVKGTCASVGVDGNIDMVGGAY
jgi:fructose-bisphosphate aldolase class I